MCSLWVFYIFLTVSLAIEAKGDIPRVAIAILRSVNIDGYVLFTETENGLHVTGSITGLEKGSYGFHIHESGDISTCDTTGGHFDIEGNTHGGRDHDIRHVGDFGNIEFDGGDIPTAIIDFIDNIVSFDGANSILGRALVLHEGKDDLGLGDHPQSLITGNAGGRVACGVIGIKSPVTPWNSAVAPVSSFMLVVASLFVFL